MAKLFVNMVLILSGWILLTTAIVSAQLNSGQSCPLQNSSNTGVCTELSRCHSAIQMIQKKQNPAICSFRGIYPIVCCKDDVPATTLRTTTVTSRDISSIPLHAQKCIEYGRYVFRLIKSILPIADAKLVNKSFCPSAVQPLIVGGITAVPGEYPHMARIGYGTQEAIKWMCEGTLISERFVLTAAHCLHHQILGAASFVRVGEFNIATTDNKTRPNFTIIERIRHPQYLPPSLYNDIGLLKLDRDAILDELVRPACLHNQNPIIGTKAIATGWIYDDSFGYFNSAELSEVNVNMVSQEQCNASYSDKLNRKLSQGIVPETQICVDNSNKDICQGVSGGPLQIYNSEVFCTFKIIGVSSFGQSCGIQNMPRVYTRVSAFIPWIESIVWKT